MNRGGSELEREKILEISHMQIAFCQYQRGIQQIQLPVIRDLNVTVHAGEIVAVVGSSGSGKSLLAHGIMGILPYNATMEGEVYYCGENLTEKKIKQLRGKEIVLVPQSTSYLDPLMKVGQQICKGKKTPEKSENWILFLKSMDWVRMFRNSIRLNCRGE